MEQQDRAVAAIIAESFRMQLGGARGAAWDWAVCLAARGDASTNLRSQIGNALALKARAAGLRPVAAVIYVEVLPCYNSKTPTKLLLTRCWRGGGLFEPSSTLRFLPYEALNTQ